MKIGFTFDEKVFMQLDILDQLKKLKASGASSIELALDPNIMEMDNYLEIARICSKLKIDINYHIPYFISEYYSVGSFFLNESLSLKKYKEFLDGISLLSEYSDSKNSTIVVHGEEFASASEKKTDNTVKFLEFLLRELDIRQLSNSLAIETLRLGEKSKVGDNRSELVGIIKSLNSDRIGICLDICHDSLNYYPNKAAEDLGFFSYVNYAHIHGFDLSSGQNHVSLTRSSLNFLKLVAKLKKIKPEMTLNLESLSDFTGDTYIDDLFSDIDLLKTVL